MKRGQGTLEYIFLILIVATGFIAMIVYVSRGHQGRLRSQANQLSAEQYAPGKTTINNRENKTLASTAKEESSTPVAYGNMNEQNTALEAVLAQIVGQWKIIYQLRQSWEELVVPEAITEAAKVRAGTWPWIPPSGGIAAIEDLLKIAYINLNNLYDQAAALASAWPKRTKDTTGSTEIKSSGKGTLKIQKTTDEALGDL